MPKEFDKVGEIREIHTFPVSARGSGLCLYLPKSLCELHGVIAGDRVRAQLLDHYRQKNPDAEDGISRSSAKVRKREKGR